MLRFLSFKFAVFLLIILASIAAKELIIASSDYVIRKKGNPYYSRILDNSVGEKDSFNRNFFYFNKESH